MTDWQPYREPLRTTLTRTIGIALVAGVVTSHWWGGLQRWPIASALMLWPSLGGHWVELWFLNWLRPRLPAARAARVMARGVVWFVGGIALLFAMKLTATLLIGYRPAPWPPWWIGGLGFVAIELVVHG